MRTLAIDTSLPTGAVAAADGSRLAVRTLPTAGEHARLLAGALEAVAADLGWSVADAELVAVIRGPGSFTGLRVGVATAKAVCWACGGRLLGISSCEVIARAAAGALDRHDAPVWVAFDAGRGDVFATRVVPTRTSPSGWLVEAGSLAAADTWLATLAAGSIVGGPGLALLHDAAERRPDVVVAPATAWTPDVADVVAVARLRAAAGEADDPAALVPDYIRPSYADERTAPLSPPPAGGTIGAVFRP